MTAPAKISGTGIDVFDMSLVTGIDLLTIYDSLGIRYDRLTAELVANCMIAVHNPQDHERACKGLVFYLEHRGAQFRGTYQYMNIATFPEPDRALFEMIDRSRQTTAGQFLAVKCARRRVRNRQQTWGTKAQEKRIEKRLETIYYLVEKLIKLYRRIPVGTSEAETVITVLAAHFCIEKDPHESTTHNA